MSYPVAMKKQTTLYPLIIRPRRRYTIALGDGSAEVSGVITVRGHYFENGNIQLQTSKEVSPKTISFSVRIPKTSFR